MAQPYPVDIPNPTLGGSFECAPDVIRSDDQTSGEIVQRLKSSNIEWRHQVSWLFDSVEYRVFIDWFENTLKNGSLAFEMPLQYAEVETKICRFVDGSLSVANRGVLMFQVAAEVVSYEQPASSQAEEYQMVFASPAGDLFAYYEDAPSNLNVVVGGVYEGPVVYDLVDGELPVWAELNQISPTDAELSLAPPDASGAFQFINFAMSDAFHYRDYAYTFKTIYGTQPATFAVVDGSLPSWLTLDNATGLLSGTPPVLPLRMITQRIRKNGFYGVGFWSKVVALYGEPPVSYSVSAGALPDGLTLNVNTGVISGVVPIDRGGAPAFLNQPDLKVGIYDQAYWNKLYTTGGKGDISFSVVAGSLPPGITLDPNTGELTGTVTSP